MKRNEYKKYLFKKCGSLDGKTAVVTGATGTIGKWIVIHLLTLGANVILAVRNTKKGEELKGELSKTFDANKISVMGLDVADFSSINKFAESIKDININYLINNAGALHAQQGSSGEDIQYLTNFVGPMYLTIKLLGQLDKQKNSRVVFQSSVSYRFSKIDWNDPQGKKVKRDITKYARTKRMVNACIAALRANELKKYKNVKAEIIHPGVCSTNIFGRDKNAFQRFISKVLRVLSRPLFHSGSTAALPAEMALTRDVPDNKVVAPWAFGIWGRPKLRNFSRKLMRPDEVGKAQALLDREMDRLKDKK